MSRPRTAAMDKLVKHAHASKRYSLARASKDVGAAIKTVREVQEFTDTVSGILYGMTRTQRAIATVSIAAVIIGTVRVAEQFPDAIPRKRKAKRTTTKEST